MDPMLLCVLFDLHTLADHDDTFQIISGYRSPATISQLRRKSGGVAEHWEDRYYPQVAARMSGF